MPASTPSPVRVRPGPRTVLMRPGVGAAGHIVQRSDLTTHRVVVDQATLILVEAGRKRIGWSGGACVARPGEALSLQAGSVVDISNTPGPDGTYRALWICWGPDLLGRPHGPAGPRVTRHTGLDGNFHAAFHRAFDSLDDTTALPASIAAHRLEEILLWLAERGFRFAAPKPPSPGLQVRRLLAADPAADWSMDQVAQAIATSVPTLRRKLAAEGVVFRDLVQDVRMAHALALLQNTDTPVLHVAQAAGYASTSRFAARFRARFGYLPTDIRGQHRGRNPSTVTRTPPC